MKSFKVAIISLLVALAGCILGPLAAQIPGPANGTGPAGPKALIHRAEAAKETEILEKNFKVALLVGIGDYDPSITGIPELNFPVADIRTVATTLKLQGYTPIILTDRQATAARIRQQLKYMADEVETGKGTAIFYFSGHGFRIGGENFLATYDTTLDQLASQGLAVSEVQKLLAATGAKQRVLFIDACRNDPTAKSITAGRPFEQFEDSEGLRILYSTGPGKVSYEDEALQQGVFSYYVAKGLRGDAAGPDGMITFDDLRNWVSDNMRRYGAEHQRPQIPYQLGESTGDFLLARKASSDVIGLADPIPAPPPPAPVQPNPGGGGRVAPPPPPVNPDPPARVARLSLTDGTVTFQPAGVQEWTAAETNRPLTTGDSLWVDEIGHAEVEIANGALRLSEKTGFTILNLDDHTTQIKLTQGNLAVRMTRINSGEIVEVDTPNTAVAIRKAGDYQLKVSPTGDTTVVTVSDGSAEASAGARNVTLAKSQSATVSGIQSPTLNLSAPAPDPGSNKDRYFDARDRRPESMSSAYVADGMVGTSDLDDNGTWLSVRGYGMAWIPRVPKGWEPYRFGHWAWVDPWGWSWVDDQPWGFAPFHYGRWIQVDVGWAWLPGGAGVQAAYSPAMVAWTGTPGAGAAAGAPVGWFPLGPNEVYVPSFTASPQYMNLVNATNVNVASVNVMKVNPSQANYSYRSQATMVSHDTFVGSGHVSDRTMMPVSRTDMSRSRVSNFAGAAPQKESLLGPSAGRQRISQPPPAVMNRTVVARTTPPPTPVPFDMQQRALSTNQGRPMSPMERRRAQPVMRTDVLPAASRPEGREPGPPGVRPAGRESVASPVVRENPRAQPAKPLSPIEQQRTDRATAQAAALAKQKELRAQQQEALQKRQQDQAAARAAQQKALAEKQAEAKEAAAEAAAARAKVAPPARPQPPAPRPAPVKPPPAVKPVVPPQ
jgi:hypothetical protein